MSKIEAGSVALSEDKFRIDGVLEEVSEIIRPMRTAISWLTQPV